MKNNNLLSVIVVITICLIPILSCISVSTTNIEKSSNSILTTPDSYIIDNINYTGQDTNFFCSFACLTMTLDYYGINISQQGVVYNSGVGYSLIYPTLKKIHLPYTGWQSSQEPATLKFLSELYGLSYKTWKRDLNLSSDEQWKEDLINIKQNLSNDIPIIIGIDEIILLTDNIGLGFLFPIIKNIPFTAGHAILLIGYDENNETLCYNDPLLGLFNKSEYGSYILINYTKFKTSLNKHSKKLDVRLFYDTPEPFFSKDESFRKAHKRNIEKLKGNISAYFDEDTEDIYKVNRSFGINATRRLRGDLGNGIYNQIKTAFRYKFNNRFGLMYRLMSNLHILYPNLFQINLEEIFLESDDAFVNIALEKKYNADYLRHIENQLDDENLSKICLYESKLLEFESENWSRFADYYSEFRKKGIFMSLPRAIHILNKMADTMDNIISIEESIIAGHEEN